MSHAVHRMVPWRRAGCVLALSALALAPGRVAAQSVRGRLLEAEADAPVAAATIVLLDAETGDTAAAPMLTDSLGQFLLRAPAAGRYRLRAGRIGYHSITSPPFTLVKGDETDVELRISATAVPLAPLTIMARRPAYRVKLETQGFYEREKMFGIDGSGSGSFLDRKDIEKTAVLQTQDLLRGIPGVQVSGGGAHRSMITLRGGCHPTMFLDGVPMRQVEDSDIPPLRELDGVEVYASYSEVPIQFIDVVREARGLKPCGVIVLWTGGGERPG